MSGLLITILFNFRTKLVILRIRRYIVLGQEKGVFPEMGYSTYPGQCDIQPSVFCINFAFSLDNCHFQSVSTIGNIMILYVQVNLFFIVILCLAAANGRVWFIGDSMPGTNWTITERPSPTPSWAGPLHVNTDRLERIIGRGVTRMALSMESVSGNETENFLFAPVSVAAALSVVLLGATGQTAAEIASFLGLLAGVDFTDRTHVVHKHLGRFFTKFEQNPGIELGSQLAFANGVFIQESFSIEPKFDEIARNFYKCEVMPLDFKKTEKARLIVNEWISNRTNNRIKEILPYNPNPETKLIIANALYFKGQWEYPFFANTRVGSFHVSKTEEIDMPFMVNGAEIPYYSTKNYSIFGMPYKGGQLVMYIVLPQHNLHKFVNNLTLDSIENMMNHTKVQTVLYSVPRMKIESTLNLRKPLEELGIGSLFNPKTADLSGIAEGLYVDNIYHKVEIEVTETGTVAAAGTAAGFIRGGLPLVKVNRPFLFFIHHQPTNTIIFWGSVYKPTPFFEREM